MKRTINVIALVLGVLFLGLAIYYWMTPANALPSFLPGYDPTMLGVHIKHGIASLVVGAALIIFAWFNSAKKAS